MSEPTGRYRTQADCPDCQAESGHKINRDGVWVCNECGVVHEPGQTNKKRNADFGT